jgi:hypothetical protein
LRCELRTEIVKPPYNSESPYIETSHIKLKAIVTPRRNGLIDNEAKVHVIFYPLRRSELVKKEVPLEDGRLVKLVGIHEIEGRQQYKGGFGETILEYEKAVIPSYPKDFVYTDEGENITYFDHGPGAKVAQDLLYFDRVVNSDIQISSRGQCVFTGDGKFTPAKVTGPDQDNTFNVIDIKAYRINDGPTKIDGKVKTSILQYY